MRPFRCLAPLALLLAAGLGSARAEPAPAAGGHALLEAAASAPEVLVGRVVEPSQLDLHGWRASLVVERTLSGARAVGAQLRIGWEELSPKRPARFADGARVLVALGPLPPGSLWSQRFPKRDALAVAARGEAFLREPDAATLEPLAAWLALPAAGRTGPDGVAALASLAAAGDAAVAASAIERLGRVDELGAVLNEAAAAQLAALFADEGRPLALRRAALALAGQRTLHALEPAIAALAAAPSDVQGAAVDALGQIRGGFAPERASDLLAAEDPAVRAAAVRQGGARMDTEQLRALLRRDASGEVRAAAAEGLAGRGEAGAAEDLVRALRDHDAPVRSAAMKGLAGLGAPAVQALQREIWEASPSDPPGALAPAVLTLSMVGPSGMVELQRISHEHPSEKVRRLADLALGHLPKDH